MKWSVSLFAAFLRSFSELLQRVDYNAIRLCRSYEKRKSAALEIEKLIKECNASKDGKKTIVAIITMLRDDFIESTQANQRKGGLIGLAATSIGLMKVRYIRTHMRA